MSRLPNTKEQTSQIPIDPELFSQSTEGFSWSASPATPPTSITPGPAMDMPTRGSSTIEHPQPRSNKRVKVDPVEKLKTSVKELADTEIVRAKEETIRIKEEFAYKRYKRDQLLEEKKLRFQAQMQLYEFRFKQWVENKVGEEPQLPRFD